MKHHSQANFLFFFLVTVKLVHQGSCSSATACFNNNSNYCLTQYQLCTQKSTDCTNSCTINSQCQHTQTCCEGYCILTSFCSSNFGFNTLNSTVTTIIIVIPIVFFSILCCCIIGCVVKASRRREALKNQADQDSQIQNQQQQMMQVLNQHKFGNTNIFNTDQQIMQQQMIIIQQPMMQQQVGIMHGGGGVDIYQPVLPVSNQVVKNPQMVSNQGVYLNNPLEEKQQMNKQMNNGKMVTYI